MLETPETYTDANAGSHAHVWTGAERKEMEGLKAAGAV